MARLLATCAARVLIPLVLSSCERPEPPAVVPQPPVGPMYSGVPTMRVQLTPRAVPRAVLASSGPCRLLVDGRVAREFPASVPVTEVCRRQGGWQVGGLLLSGRELLLAPVGDSYVQCGTVLYRGDLRLLPAGDRSLVVINHVDMESYLAGVLPKELYPGWSLEAYRALAVAARTFAMYQKEHSARGGDHDLGADTGSQVYGGFSAETGKSRLAVKSTRGVVLAYGPAGRERVILAQYSACCGGVVNSAGVLRNAEDIEPFRGGQRCDDCQACRLYRWPSLQIAKADIYDALKQAYASAAALGGVKAIRVASTTSYGRALWLDVDGTVSGKSLRLRAEDLRLALLQSGLAAGRKLYSMNCKLRDLGTQIEFCDGHGFGHGVGMCQWGVEGKAQKGWKAERIIAFYYPGAKLFQAY